MDLLRPIELLLLVVVDGVRQLSVAFGEVHVEDRLRNATWRRNNKVEGPWNPFVHADVGESRLLAEGRGQILRKNENPLHLHLGITPAPSSLTFTA